jgi:protein-tyrosine phosphatase
VVALLNHTFSTLFKHIFKSPPHLFHQDIPGQDLTNILYDIFDYLEDVRTQHGRVFVHCCLGVSRSTSLVIAYLMWRENRPFDETFRDVKAIRGTANPNMGFACQVRGIVRQRLKWGVHRQIN